MRIHDVTVPIRPGMVTYPGDPTVSLERVLSISDGALANVSKLELGVHTGTHVDAPVHFIDGAAAVETLRPEVLVGKCVVVEGIQAPDGVARVLFKTSNSELWARDSFVEDFISLDGATARALVAKGIRLVGIDYLSIGGEAAHKALLRAGVVVIEGLDLRAVEPGEYLLACAPLKLVASDGAPARVFLIETEGASDG